MATPVLKEFLTEAIGLDFPFVGEITDTNVREFFADIYVSYNPDRIPTSGTAVLSMNDIDWNGTTLAFEIKMSDGSSLLLTSSSTNSSYNWGNWTVHTYSNTYCDIKVVTPNYHSSFTAAGPFKLGARNVEPRTYKITKFRLEDAVVVDPTGAVINATPANYDFTDDVQFVAGFNIDTSLGDDPEISLADPGDPTIPPPVLPVNILNMDVVPGSGQGRYPTCLDPASFQLYVRSINGIKADDTGNVNLELTNCYRWEREVNFEGTPPGEPLRQGTVTPGELWLIGDCKSCTKCQDYADLYKLLRVLYKRAAAIWQRMQVTRNYHDHLVRITKVVQAYMDKPEAEFRVVQSAENTFTLHVSMRTGDHTYNQLLATITPPVGFTVEYIKYNGWEKLPNLRQRQNDTLFGDGSGFIVNRTLQKQTNAWWSWSIKLKPTTGYALTNARVDPACPTKLLVDGELSATVTLREMLPNGTLQGVVWGPLDRDVELKVDA